MAYKTCHCLFHVRSKDIQAINCWSLGGIKLAMGMSLELKLHHFLLSMESEGLLSVSCLSATIKCIVLGF